MNFIRTFTFTRLILHKSLYFYLSTECGYFLPSLVLTEPEQDKDLPIATVKTQEILQGNVVRESAEGHGTIE